MRKHISFAIAATIAGLAVVFWAIAGGVYTKADIVRPKVELSSSISQPHLPAQVSLETGLLVEGAAAAQVARLVEAVLRVARSL
jgi:hypothetical protein